LSTAGLRLRKVYIKAQAVENADDGLSSFGEECVDQTSNKELYGWHAFIVIPFRGNPNLEIAGIIAPL
jgi:hypothetical protein